MLTLLHRERVLGVRGRAGQGRAGRDEARDGLQF